MTDAAFNLLQLEQRPNWYDHIDQVERAMADEEETWSIRRSYGWEGDDGGTWGPNPLDPEASVLDVDWEDTLALPFPEDFTMGDEYVYGLMETIGKHKHDPVVMAHMVAMHAAQYLSVVGQDMTCAIAKQLRLSDITLNASDD